MPLAKETLRIFFSNQSEKVILISYCCQITQVLASYWCNIYLDRQFKILCWLVSYPLAKINIKSSRYLEFLHDDRQGCIKKHALGEVLNSVESFYGIYQEIIEYLFWFQWNLLEQRFPGGFMRISGGPLKTMNFNRVLFQLDRTCC